MGNLLQQMVTRKKANWHSGRESDPFFLAVTYLFLLILAVATVIPFVVMFSASLAPNLPYLKFPMPLIPEGAGLQNYVNLFTRTLAARWLWNSILITTIGTLMMVITSAMSGYAFSRGDFIGKDVLFIAFLGILMVPMTVRIVPIYMLMAKFGWTNTYWVLIGPWSGSAFGVFFMRQQFASIPTDYDDAATVDGANRYRILFSVLLPQIKAGLMTLAVLRFMAHWNDFLYPMMLTSQPTMRTLTVGLATIGRETGEIDAGFAMAAAVIGFLPTFLVFLIGQRFIVEGFSLSGLKG